MYQAIQHDEVDVKVSQSVKQCSNHPDFESISDATVPFVLASLQFSTASHLTTKAGDF